MRIPNIIIEALPQAPVSIKFPEFWASPRGGMPLTISHLVIGALPQAPSLKSFSHPVIIECPAGS